MDQLLSVLSVVEGLISKLQSVNYEKLEGDASKIAADATAVATDLSALLGDLQASFEPKA